MAVITTGEDSLRVALVTAGAAVGGAEKQMYYMARGLARMQVGVRVFNLSSGGVWETALAREGISTTYIGRFPSPFLRLLNVVRAIGPFRPHIIQSIHAYTNFYSALAGNIIDALSVGGLRGSLDAHRSEFPILHDMLLRLPHGLIVNSRCAYDGLRTGKPTDDRVHLLHNVIDIGDTGRRRRCDKGFTCVWIGRIIRLKRVDLFIRAVAMARSVEPSVTAMIVGRGVESESLKRLGSELRLPSDALRFLGERHDVADLLDRSSVLVLCSDFEGTPNVVLEAMAAGVPVITTPAGDAPELVGEANAGFVVPFDDPQSIADAIVRLTRSRTLLQDLGQNGRLYVHSHHSAANVADNLLEIYEKIASGVRRHSRGRALAAIRAARMVQSVRQN